MPLQKSVWAAPNRQKVEAKTCRRAEVPGDDARETELLTHPVLKAAFLVMRLEGRHVV